MSRKHRLVFEPERAWMELAAYVEARMRGLRGQRRLAVLGEELKDAHLRGSARGREYAVSDMVNFEGRHNARVT
jgi:hypothetical protein